MSKTQGIKFADHGTEQLQSKGEIKLREVENGIYRQAYVTNQTVIERLYNRKQITPEQYMAARRLQNDYLRAYLSINLKARIIVELSTGDSKRKDYLLDYCNLDAKKRYSKAMESLQYIGKDALFYQKLIEWVIIEDGYLKDLKCKNEDLDKVTLEDLKKGLEALIQFYLFCNKVD